jgi:hypothetical protein
MTYNRKYYLENRERLIKMASIRAKLPHVKEKVNKKNRERYATDSEFKERQTMAHKKYLSNPLNRKKSNLAISIWGITKRDKKKTADKWKRYYAKNKEKYLLKRKEDRLKSTIIRRALNCKDSSIEELKKDIEFLSSLINS